MSFNYHGQRPFTIADPSETSTNRESFSSRPNNTPSYLTHTSSRDQASNEAYYPFDDRLADAMRKFKGPATGEKSQNIEDEATTLSFYSKKSIQSDADDMFENFDKCYQASFPTSKTSTATEGHSIEVKAKPLCRDLLQELNIGSVRENVAPGNKKVSVSSGNRSLQKPKEFHTLKADKYFNVRASSNLNPGNRSSVREDDKEKFQEAYLRSIAAQATNRSSSISNLRHDNSRHHYDARTTHRDEENVENDSEETRHRGVRNFMFVQNAAFSKIDKNYEAVQRTLDKMRRRDGRDVSGDWAILNDITNNPHADKPTRRSSVRETGEYRAAGRMYEKETGEQYHRRSVNLGNDPRKKINVSNMIASYHSKENNQPTVRNSYNGKSHERSRSKETGKIQTRAAGDRGAGYGKEHMDVSNRNKRSNNDGLERRSVKLEKEKEPMTTYQALIKYYELARKGSKGGNVSTGTTGRSTSASRW